MRHPGSLGASSERIQREPQARRAIPASAVIRILALSESGTAVLLAVIAGIISIAQIISTTIRAKWQMHLDVNRRHRRADDHPGDDYHQEHHP
jgi:hypothetical protein